MREQFLVRIMYHCDLGPGSGTVAVEATRGRLMAELATKELAGFLVPYRGRFLGLIEGRQRKVINLVEKLVRKGILKDLEILGERDDIEPILDEVAAEANALSDLPTELFDSCEILAACLAAEVKPT